MSEKFYIYTIRDTEDQVFYIGQTKNVPQRRKRHIYEAQYGVGHCSATPSVRGVLLARRDLNMQVLCIVGERAEARRIEKALIGIWDVVNIVNNPRKKHIR